MATATTSFGLSKPSTSCILPPKILNSFSITVKFRPLLGPTIAYSITNSLTDSSKPLNAATATYTSSSTSTIWKTTTQGTLCVKYAVQEATGKLSFSEGAEEPMEQLKKWPEALGDAIPSENGTVILSERWDAQWCGFESPPQWLSSSGLGAMGYVSPPPKHQMCAAQGHGFKVQLVEFTSSGLGTLRNTVCSHDQCEIFAAEGYDRVSGKPGVCIATSGPGATNLVSGLADALLDSVPFLDKSRTGAFQGTPFVEVTLTITKHNYLAPDVEDILWMQKARDMADIPCMHKDFVIQFSDDFLYGGGCTDLWFKAFGDALELGAMAFGLHAAKHQIWAAQGYGLKAQLVELGTSSGLRAMGVGLLAAKHQMRAIQMYALKAQLVELGTSSGLEARGFRLHAAEHQRRAAQGLGTSSGLRAMGVGLLAAKHQMRAIQMYALKAQLVELGTSSGLGAMGFRLGAAEHQRRAAQGLGTSSGLRAMGVGLLAAKHQMRAIQMYALKAQLVELGTSSGLGAMGFRLGAAEHQRRAAQGLGTSSGLRAMRVGLHATEHQTSAVQICKPPQLATSSGLGATGIGLYAAIVVWVIQKIANPFLWIKIVKGVKLGIIFLEIVKLLQFIRKKLGIIFPQIVELFQTGP